MSWVSLAGLGIFFGASFGGAIGSPLAGAGATVPPSQQEVSQQRRLWNQSCNRENNPCRQLSQQDPHEPLQP
jgi:hypothetical protein